MAATLQHISDIYLHALLYHRSHQCYLQLKCLECLDYPVTAQAPLGISRYSSRMPSMCEVSREVDNNQLRLRLRSYSAGSCKEVPKASSPLRVLFEIILAAVSVIALKILEWCSQHKHDPALTQDDGADSRRKTTDIEARNQKFMQVDHEVVLAADYMDIKALLDIGCKMIVNTTKHKPLEDIRKTSTHGRKAGPRSHDDAGSRKKTTDIEEWDQKFMQVDQKMLFEIIPAANYTDIKALLDVGCKTIADMIKGKPPEDVLITSTQGWKIGQTHHDDDTDSRKTTTGIEKWHVQNRPFNLHEFQSPLLDAGCKTVANMIKGKPPDEIRKTFNIQNDFTPEEDQNRLENDWTDLRGVTSSKNGRGRRSNLVKNSQEGRNLFQKTAEAGVATSLKTRRRGVTSSKKRHWDDWLMVSDENLLQRTIDEKARFCADSGGSSSASNIIIAPSPGSSMAPRTQSTWSTMRRVSVVNTTSGVVPSGLLTSQEWLLYHAESSSSAAPELLRFGPVTGTFLVARAVGQQMIKASAPAFCIFRRSTWSERPSTPLALPSLLSAPHQCAFPTA